MGKSDALARCVGQEKFEYDTHLINERHLLELENDHVREEEDAEDVQLEGIDVVIWKNKNGL